MVRITVQDLFLKGGNLIKKKQWFRSRTCTYHKICDIPFSCIWDYYHILPWPPNKDNPYDYRRILDQSSHQSQLVPAELRRLYTITTLPSVWRTYSYVVDILDSSCTTDDFLRVWRIVQALSLMCCNQERGRLWQEQTETCCW